MPDEPDDPALLQCAWSLCQATFHEPESDAINPDLYCSAECETNDA